jgi:signal transduction histidine kinase
MLLEPDDYETTLAAVASLALPEIGSWSIVDLCDPSGSMRRVAVVHPDPEMQLLARRLVQGWPPETEDPIGAPVVMRTGATTVVSEVTDSMLRAAARDDDTLEILRGLGIGSFVVVPLVAHENVLGAITFVHHRAGRTYSEQDLSLAEGLAALGALAIDRAQRYDHSVESRDQAVGRAEAAEGQQRDLEKLMEIQARLIRGFSHDVKNPLGAAQGYVQLLEEGIIDTLTAKQKHGVVRIGASIRDALALIDDLVEYAKDKMRRIDIRRSQTDVGEATHSIVEEYRAQIESAGLEVTFAADPGLQPIETDRVRVRQILGNLISNAVKYTEHGRVSVEVAGVPAGEAAWAGEWITVRVADTGRGIPAEDQDRVFREFNRLAPAVAHGFGLGLATSRWIADALGAHITLSSEIGHGSTFSLWLPADPTPRVPAEVG